MSGRLYQYNDSGRVTSLPSVIHFLCCHLTLPKTLNPKHSPLSHSNENDIKPAYYSEKGCGRQGNMLSAPSDKCY